MIQWILAFSVRRRWYVLLFTIAAAVSGAWALTVLPIDAVPDITNVQVQVNAFAPALSPLEVEKQVTFPIEVALAGTPGLEKTWSFSRNGFAQVTAVFSDRTDIYFARQQVTERLNDAKPALPPGVDIKMGPISTGLGEVYWWSVGYAPAGEDVHDGAPGWQSDGSYLTPEGERLADEVSRLVYLRTVQDWIIRPQLKTVRGVAGADAIGGYIKQYRVEPDAAKLVGYGLSVGQLVSAIEANNASRGANYIERFGEGYVVRTSGRVETLAEIGDIVVAARGDIPIHVKDVAEVTIGRDLRLGSASMNGREAVLGTVLMLVGGNSRTVAAAVDAKIDEINHTLPPSIRVQTVLNRTQLVDATVRTVATNLLEGASLVVVVLLLLLGNFRAALVTALVIPVTMLITAMGMLQVKLSANLMSLGALDFGLIVDGAVIIAENSLRHLAERQRQLGRALREHERLDTVTESASEVIGPTVYGQFIIGLVYVPLLTFSGVEGKTFQPMALTVLIALMTAFVLSLTFMPAMLAILVTGKVNERDNGFVRGLKALYRPVLSAVIRRPMPAIAAGVASFACAALLFPHLGQEFIPKLDEKNIVMEVKRIPSTSLSQSQAMQFINERMIARFPQVAFVFSRSGTPDLAADPMPPSATDTYIILKPRPEWPDPDLPKNELIAGVREDLAVSVFGDEFEPMLRAANQIAAVLEGVRGTTEVKVEDVTGMPILEIRIDKAEIARHGLTLSAVQDVVGIAVGGRAAGLVFEGDRRFQIVVRLSDVERNNIEILKNLPVPLPGALAHAGDGAAAATLPLRVLADFNLSEGPNQVSRENGKRRVVVTADVRGRDIGSAVGEAQAKIAQRVTLPPGYWLTWGGQFENFTAARQRLVIVVPVCFALIFLLLLGALGSWRDALLVFSAVPLALTGGVAALWLRDMTFSISSAVGFIALSGVAVLNGLVMITFIKQLVDEGMAPHDAVYHGALTRLRPVVMTALVASLGFVPMAIATGTGAEVQKPLATVVIGGLISATLLTLVVLPALYARFSGTATKSENKPRLVMASRLPSGESMKSTLRARPCRVHRDGRDKPGHDDSI
jgi:heavy metal efflux system protein